MGFHNGNQLIDPYLIFKKAHVQPGMHVADFGCGRTGHMIFPLAKMIGEDSIIYAIDILKPVLATIEKRAKLESFLQVHTIWADIECVGGTAIASDSVDVVLFVNTLTHVNNRHGALEEARRVLKAKGRIVIVDWIKTGLSFSPADERFVDFIDIMRWARMHGFSVQEEFIAGKYHKGLVLYQHI
ncbi:methyltransferase domain-containing protein [Patescibacteria group bacterium]|nr:methyltransferase domain-containing protein [Patescibacteria group bacterium]MBU1721526.1 methyltransferase domain-containing protein [Patescibacteria group bacterium]MBU1901492.1 methyltransferase domain-containing protein [Patescibacteria group bacterium]